MIDGNIDWVVSDHACCKDEMKFGEGDDRDDIFMAKSGFGGAEYLLPALVSEGLKRGLSEQRIAQLVALNPARRYGLSTKGDIAIGLDADIALVDTTRTVTIKPEDSESVQEYTPFEGFTLNAQVTDTFVQVRAPHTLGEDVLLAATEAVHTSRPVVLNVPVNFQWEQIEHNELQPIAITPQAPRPDDEAIDEALGLIASAHRPLIVAGRGATSPAARQAIIALSDWIGAGVATTRRARDLFRGEDNNVGLMGTSSDPIGTEAIGRADCVIAFGVAE